MYQSVNDIRLRGYEKAFEDCCDRSLSNQKFKLPEVGIDESNVYSRLYNNLDYLKLKHFFIIFFCFLI